MKITKGVRKTAKRVVIHGVEGIGKSTLASQFPRALVLDTEDGTNHLDVDRVTVTKWPELADALISLTGGNHGYSTIVFDSIDWAERMAVDLVKGTKNSIEDIPYGKGYTMVAEKMGRLLADCDKLIAAGVNVVLVGHTTVKRTSPPDMDEGYDRYELKLTKQSAPLVKEWADCLLFANYRTKLVEGQDGRTRAKGGKERVLHTERSAAWDAKNRYGLPAELPMTIEALSPLFDTAPAPKPQRKSWRERIADCDTVAALGDMGTAVDEAESTGKLTPEQADECRRLIADRHNVIEPEEATA